MKKVLQLEELEALALGASVLGSGGGGDPKPELARTREILQRHLPPVIIDVTDLDSEDLVVPIGFMGAPMISIEKLPSGKECLAVLDMIERYYKRAPTALVPLEIGGSNAFVPLGLASVTGLPVVDADTIGRAFPELHMSSCALSGISPSPAFLADAIGNTACVNTKQSSKIEPFCRALTELMGSSAAVALYILTGRQAQFALCNKSYTQAIEIGKEILAGTFSAPVLASGTIADIQQTIQSGFLRGKVLIVGQEGSCEIEFQNEYLIAKNEKRILAATPDILAILEKESRMPLCVERLKYGLAVDLVALKAPRIWQTEEGLAIVGPKAFGYNFEQKGMFP